MPALLPPFPVAVARWPAYQLFFLLGFGVVGGLLLLPVLEAKRLLRLLHRARRLLVALLLLSGGVLNHAPANGQARSLTISGEVAQGQYQDDVTTITRSTALLFCTFCGNGYSFRRMGYYHSYALGGVDVAYNLRQKSATGVQTIGLGIRRGTQQTGFRPQVPGEPFDETQPPASNSIMLYDINPYLIGRAKRWNIDFGYRVGLHMGRLRNEARTKADSLLLSVWFAPDAQLWVGKRRVLFAQFDSGVGLLALGNHTSRFGLGTGLGADDGRYLLAGLAVARDEGSYNMSFVSANIPLLKSRLRAEPYVATDFARHHRAHVRLSYEIPHRE